MCVRFEPQLLRLRCTVLPVEPFVKTLKLVTLTTDLACCMNLHRSFTGRRFKLVSEVSNFLQVVLMAADLSVKPIKSVGASQLMNSFQIEISFL